MIRSLIFGERRLAARDIDIAALKLACAEKDQVLWVDLENPTDEETKSILEGVFQFHPLAIEDCVTPSSLPKIEDYEGYSFMVAHGIEQTPAGTQADAFNTAELDMFLGGNFLVTFHRAEMRPIQTVMERCARASGGIVARSPDRLAHLLLDALVENFKPVTERLLDQLEKIEESVLSSESSTKQANLLVAKLLEVRVRINRLREIVRPLRDVVGRLASGESQNLRPAMLPYFRDVRDDLVRIDATAADYADRLITSFDLFLSKSDFQANEGIKTLTALTALTLPATLIATWYGMNFENMPELKSPLGYPIAAIVTVLLTAAIWLWCRRRRWI